MKEMKCFSNYWLLQRNLIILLTIVVIGIALRLYCFHGYWGADDGEYARLADAMAEGTFNRFVQENYIENFNAPAHLPFRMGLIVPLSLSFCLFGINESVLVVYPFLVSVLGIVLAFFCGRLLFGTGAGLIAAAIWAVLPVDVWYATSFLPDSISSFYASFGVFVILLFIYLNTKNKLLLFSGGFIAGLLFGISWLCKESIVYLVPFCAAYLFISMKKNWKMGLTFWVGVAIASLGILIIEMIIYHNLRGDFLLRLHENERSFMQVPSYLFYEGSRFGWPEGSSHFKALLKRLFLDGPQRIFFNSQFLFLPFFGLIASAYSLYHKDKSFLFPALWMITLCFMYNFWSCSFNSYTPLVLLHRYLHPIMLPATILTSGFLVKILSNKARTEDIGLSRERYFWGILFAVIIVATACYFTYTITVPGMKRSRPIYETRKIYNIVKPSDRLYTDPLSIKAGEFFWGYPRKSNLINFEGFKERDIQPNSYVFMDKVRLDWLKVNVSMWLTKDYGYNEPEFFQHPPWNWKIIWQNSNARLYHVE